MTKNGVVGTCYLCGLPLTAPISVDHVPPLKLFAKELRKRHNMARLLTIPVHRACNAAYSLDEQYFVNTLAPFGLKTYTGAPVLKRIIKRFHEGKSRDVVTKVLDEFDQRPSGLHLPKGKVVKRFEGDRIQRVVWKIVRGLYFHHFGMALPETHLVGVTVTAPGEIPPDHFQMFSSASKSVDHGPYPGAFAYRFDRFSHIHYWAILLWDSLILTALFADPDMPPDDDPT